jgi:hypothetical protein
MFKDITLLILGVFVTLLSERVLRWAIGNYKYSKLLSLVRDTAIRKAPYPFVNITSDVTSRGQTKQLRTFDGLADFVLSEIQSGHKVILLSGSYGTGKSFCCSVLAGSLAKKCKPSKLLIPCVVDSTLFANVDADANLQAGLNRSLDWKRPLPQPVTPEILARLLQDPRFLLILDAIDQLPYAEGVQSAMQPLLNMVEDYADQSKPCATLAVVVREEFLRHNDKLENLQFKANVSVVNLRRDFNREQIEEYAIKFSPSEKQQRIEKITDILNSANSANLEDLARPVSIDSLFKIPLAEFLKFSCSGSPLANIYSVLYRRFPKETTQVLEKLGYYLHSKDVHGVPLDPPFYHFSGLALQELTAAAEQTSAILLTENDVKFRHATLRDYFASAAIVSSLEHTTDDSHIRHPTTFLISEMVATLLDLTTLDHLLIAGLTSSDPIAKCNVCDFLSEIEQSELIARAQRYFQQEIKDQRDKTMSEYKIALLVTAGVLGDEAAINEVMNYLKKVGFSVFREELFATKQHFQYYEKREDVAIAEWINILRQPKYRYVRRLIAALLSEIKMDAPPEVLLQLAKDEREPDLELRKLAKQSYHIILDRLSMDTLKAQLRSDERDEPISQLEYTI